MLATAKRVCFALPVGFGVSFGLMMLVVLVSGDVLVAGGIRLEMLALEQRLSPVMMWHGLRVMSVLLWGRFSDLGSRLSKLGRSLRRRVLAAFKDMRCRRMRVPGLESRDTRGTRRRLVFVRLPGFGWRGARRFGVSFGRGLRFGSLATPAPATPPTRTLLLFDHCSCFNCGHFGCGSCFVLSRLFGDVRSLR